jgi:tripartite-type tricarboxylate transporter receptor subunit TctC
MATAISKTCRAAGVSRRLAMTVLCLMTISAPAYAEYPERVITAIVPFAPGGANDIVARVMSPYLAQKFGQSVVVQNRPGAAGNVGIDATAKSKPDGYTILFSATASTQNPGIFKTMPFDPLKDIIPVAELAESEYAIFVKVASPIHTIKDLLDEAQKNPGKLNGAAGGIGTRLSIELFNQQYKVKTEIIAYDGTGPSATALLTGESDFAITDPSPLLSAVKAGRVRAVAVAGAKRLDIFPDLPTTAEEGMPEYTAGAPFGVYVAAGTPQPIIDKLHDALNEIVQLPEVQKKLNELGLAPISKSQAEFIELYRNEIAKWKKVVQEANIPLIE